MAVPIRFLEHMQASSTAFWAPLSLHFIAFYFIVSHSLGPGEFLSILVFLSRMGHRVFEVSVGLPLKRGAFSAQRVSSCSPLYVA